MRFELYQAVYDLMGPPGSAPHGWLEERPTYLEASRGIPTGKAVREDPQMGTEWVGSRYGDAIHYWYLLMCVILSGKTCQHSTSFNQLQPLNVVKWCPIVSNRVQSCPINIAAPSKFWVNIYWPLSARMPTGLWLLEISLCRFHNSTFRVCCVWERFTNSAKSTLSAQWKQPARY